MRLMKELFALPFDSMEDVIRLIIVIKYLKKHIDAMKTELSRNECTLLAFTVSFQDCY